MAVAEAFEIDGKELLRLAEERAEKNSEPGGELESLRQQVETRMDVAEGLRNIALETVERLCAYWEAYTPGWSVNQNGRRRLLEWLRTYSLEELTYGMDVAAGHYLRRDDQGRVIPESWEIAFWKIRGVCRTERALKDEPDLRDLYYIRGILKNKCVRYFDNVQALKGLKAARSWGIPIAELRDIALAIDRSMRFSPNLNGLRPEAQACRNAATLRRRPPNLPNRNAVVAHPFPPVRLSSATPTVDAGTPTLGLGHAIPLGLNDGSCRHATQGRLPA